MDVGVQQDHKWSQRVPQPSVPVTALVFSVPRLFGCRSRLYNRTMLGLKKKRDKAKEAEKG
ncbi:hypothetical protein [Rathayibacter toxicus]|uniref:Uncharacterized protein n=1 Tax=Rathayibacter toxicus TaxID=145458 RepID=A0A0U1PV09_9MICO|nr:hypothetical protein [Rathayibacter toxicus]KKM46354.1 hypothetical protein VT73_04885 [Rathayibacter toxicus]